jgi:hypothetical protein
LHQQAPLQNLLTGACMRIFGNAVAFTVLDLLYTALGLTTVLCILHAMLRLGAARWLAGVSVSLYAASPVTVFYETWLFYHMPVAALLLLSLVALLRYFRTGTFGAGLCFFCLFAGVSLFYSMFSPLLLVAVTLVLLLRPPSPERAGVSPRARMLWAFSIPFCLLVLNQAKTKLLVGHEPGTAYLWENLAVKTYDEMRPADRQILVDRGQITRAPALVLFAVPLSSYAELRIPHKPTGVPLLDLETTPDGNPNPHAIEKVLIAEKHYKHDALYLLRHHFDYYWRSVIEGLTVWYFTSPMDYDDTIQTDNRKILSSVAKRTDRWLLPDSQGRLLTLVVGLPITLIYGLYRLLGPRTLLESERSTVAAFSYMLLIIAYVTFATTLISVGDFSRYRFNIDPFYLIIFVLMLTDCAKHATVLWRRVCVWYRSRYEQHAEPICGNQ